MPRFEHVDGRVVTVTEGSREHARCVRLPVWSEVAGGPAAPPKAGQGSGRDAWADYATSLGLDVEGLSRDEIIETVGG